MGGVILTSIENNQAMSTLPERFCATDLIPGSNPQQLREDHMLKILKLFY